MSEQGSNPYNVLSQGGKKKGGGSLQKKVTFVFGAIGLLIPMIYGIYLVLSVRLIQRAPENDIAYDGTPALVGWVIILVGAPASALILMAFGKVFCFLLIHFSK